MGWRVTFPYVHSNGEVTYRVDAPEDAKEADVIASAFEAHRAYLADQPREYRGSQAVFMDYAQAAICRLGQ